MGTDAPHLAKYEIRELINSSAVLQEFLGVSPNDYARVKDDAIEKAFPLDQYGNITMEDFISTVGQWVNDNQTSLGLTPEEAKTYYLQTDDTYEMDDPLNVNYKMSDITSNSLYDKAYNVFAANREKWQEISSLEKHAHMLVERLGDKVDAPGDGSIKIGDITISGQDWVYLAHLPKVDGRNEYEDYKKRNEYLETLPENVRSHIKDIINAVNDEIVMSTLIDIGRDIETDAILRSYNGVDALINADQGYATPQNTLNNVNQVGTAARASI